MKPADYRVLLALLASFALALGAAGCGDDDGDDDDDDDDMTQDAGVDAGGMCLEEGAACEVAGDCCSGYCADLDGSTNGEDDPQCVSEELGTIYENFQTSLHRTRAGKRYFYDGTAEDPGYGVDTGVDYDELVCQDCHRKGTEDPSKALLADGTEIELELYEPTCADCHEDPYDPNGEIPTSLCRGCHGRQNAEISLSMSPNPAIAGLYGDVHRDAGFECVDCHGADEFHGDGTEPDSFLQRPPIGCDGCHSEGGSAGAPDPSISEHSTHAASDSASGYIQCTTCHSETVTTCYSCHFRSEFTADHKTFFGPPPLGGFVFLVNDAREGGGITTATYQSLTTNDTEPGDGIDDKDFVAFGPYYGHTVDDPGVIGEDDDNIRRCVDCHGTFGSPPIDNVSEYTPGEPYRITTWIPSEDDAEPGTVQHRGGVIPIPQDWRETFVFDLVTADVISPTLPQYRLSIDETPGFQMLEEFATPLTDDQMRALGADIPE